MKCIMGICWTDVQLERVSCKKNLLDISKTRWNEYEVDVYRPGEPYYNKLKKL